MAGRRPGRSLVVIVAAREAAPASAVATRQVDRAVVQTKIGGIGAISRQLGKVFHESQLRSVGREDGVIRTFRGDTGEMAQAAVGDEDTARCGDCQTAAW